MAGRGLYGVAIGNVAFAQTWGKSKDRVTSFEVQPPAKLVDISEGNGAQLYQAYRKNHPEGNEDTFADYFGIDILRYPYDRTVAYVV